MLTLLLDRPAMILLARFPEIFSSEDIATLDDFVPRIIVAPDTMKVGLGRMFQSYQELSGNTEPRVVLSLGQACAAPGVPGELSEPIDFNR